MNNNLYLLLYAHFHNDNLMKNLMDLMKLRVSLYILDNKNNVLYHDRFLNVHLL